MKNLERYLLIFIIALLLGYISRVELQLGTAKGKLIVLEEIKHLFMPKLNNIVPDPIDEPVNPHAVIPQGYMDD